MSQQKLNQAIIAMKKQDFKALSSLLIELDKDNFLRKNEKGSSSLNLGGIRKSATVYHGITPRNTNFTGDEMPLPSQMIKPKKYVDLIEIIKENGLRGFHSTGHPLFLNEQFPTIYFSSTIADTHGHLGVYFKKSKDLELFTIHSENEMVLFAEQFKQNFGVYVKTFDYLTSKYDGGRSSFENLDLSERKLLEVHVKQTISELNRRGIEYKILDLGENDSLIEQFEYKEKQYN